MSMPIIERPDNPIDRDQSVNDLIESVALVETGLSHIINAEGEKIQKVVDPDADYTIEEITNVNNSVERMVNTVSKLEMMLQNKLDTVKELDTGGGSSPIIGNSYLFASNLGAVDIGSVTLPNEQVLSNFTANATNTEFTVGDAGVYLISYRISFDELSTYRAYVTVNGVIAPPSVLGETDSSNSTYTAFLYNLAAGDVISLVTETTFAPLTPLNDVSAYLCATKIG